MVKRWADRLAERVAQRNCSLLPPAAPTPPPSMQNITSLLRAAVAELVEVPADALDDVRGARHHERVHVVVQDAHVGRVGALLHLGHRRRLAAPASPRRERGLRGQLAGRGLEA